MSIAILTWLHNQNFGTLLQAYALQQYLISCGYQVQDIDYIPSKLEKISNWLKSGNSPRLFLGKAFESINRKREREFLSNLSKDKFDNFINNNINLTEKCSSSQDLFCVSQRFDTLICGSDQIWSPYLLNPNFYFAFLGRNVSNKNIISYAPSFGVTETSSKKKKVIQSELEKFSAISVREDAGKKFLQDLGYYEVEQVVDPVLLLNKEQWGALISKVMPSNRNAVVCYFLGDNPSYWHAVNSISSYYSSEVVTLVGSGKKAVDRRYNPQYALGPDEWLAYIASARFVLTDSLHGTLFSQIFRKNYYTFKRFREGDSRSQNSRVESLARLSSMTDRLLNKWSESLINNLVIEDYDSRLINLEEKIRSSERWLLNAIKQCSRG